MKFFTRYGRTLLLAAAITVGTLWLSGCGNDDDGGDGGYASVTIGGKRWMKKNLDIATADSRCYGDVPGNCAKYGRLYTWQAAKTACPGGWHLPTRSEWNGLVSAAGGSPGKKLKTADGWNSGVFGDISYGGGTDDFGFSALPAGSLDPDGEFSSLGNFGYWWTSTESGAGTAYIRAVSTLVGSVIEYNESKNYGVSVRCVAN